MIRPSDGLGVPFILSNTDPLIGLPGFPGDQFQCFPCTSCRSAASMIASIPLCFSVITGTRTTPGRSGSAYGSYGRVGVSINALSTNTPSFPKRPIEQPALILAPGSDTSEDGLKA